MTDFANDTTQDISKTDDEQLAEMIAAEESNTDESTEPSSLAELQAMPDPEPEVAPVIETTPVVAPAVAAAPVDDTPKAESRQIRRVICAWLRPMTEEQRKAISLETFKAKVLSVEPNWGIIAKGDKVVKTHLSWYRGYVKKNPVEKTAATVAAPAAAPIPAPPAVTPLTIQPTA